MEQFYTKEQVIELLNKQRAICTESYCREGIILDAESPTFPAPIQAIPVEKVREVVRALKEQLAQMDYDIRIDPEFYADKKEQLKEDIEMIEKLLSDGK